MIVALDFEGSSVSTERGCPVQLGIALMEGEEVLAQDEFILKVPVHYATGKPTREVDAYSLRVSGLTLDRIEAEGLDPHEGCRRLQDFVFANKARSSKVIAYNVGYDLGCYRNMLFFASDWHPSIRGQRVAHPEILSGTWTCAFAIARHLLPDLPDHKLDTVAQALGLSRTTELHGALEDAILAGRAYCRLGELARSRREAA